MNDARRPGSHWSTETRARAEERDRPSTLIDARDVAFHLAEACHEIRTPVAVLSLISGVLEHFEKLESDRRRQVADVVQRQCAALRAIIDGYLEHGRLAFLEEGGPTTFELDAVIREAVESLHPLVRRDRVVLSLTQAAVAGDPGRMWSIVTNLVRNAAAYSDPGSPIEVNVAVDGEEVVLDVADRGIGVARQDQETMLHPFERAEAEGRGVPEGTGLGLTIVLGHVATMGGRLAVSARDGGGTVIRATFPRG